MYRHLLVSVDDTDCAADSVGRAIELARTCGARITFVHVGSDHPDAVSVRQLLTKAESAANAQGVPCASDVRSGEPWQAVVAAAREKGCDLIYMTSKDFSGEAGTATIASASIPVIVDAATSTPASALGIDIIRDEHRSLAAVLHAWLHLSERAGADGRLASPELMHAMVRYLRDFPLALHHPKEELHLFSALRQRTSRFDAELRELERQHEHDHQLVAELDAAVVRYARGELPIAEVERLISRYAYFMWEHMGREEGVIIPAARRYLMAEDWEAINAAFKENRDPRFGDNTAAEYRGLFARILELAGRNSGTVLDN